MQPNRDSGSSTHAVRPPNSAPAATRQRRGLVFSLRATLLLLALAPVAVWIWWRWPYDVETVMTEPPSEPPTGWRAANEGGPIWPPDGYYRREVSTVRRGPRNQLVQHGPLRAYNRQGRLIHREHWRNGVLDGVVETWNAQGELVERREFARGLPHGRWKLGGGERVSNIIRVQGETRQYDRGRSVGTWTKQLSSAGSMVHITTRYRQGMRRWEKVVSPVGQRNAQVSTVTEFDANGQKVREQVFAADDKTLIRDTHFRDGDCHGPFRACYRDGRPQVEGGFRNGRPHGRWRWRDLPTIGPWRTWIAAKTSHRIEGQLVQATAETVTLRVKPTRRLVSFPRSVLSQADQAHLGQMTVDSVPSSGPLIAELDFAAGTARGDPKRRKGSVPALDLNELVETHRAALVEWREFEFQGERLDGILTYVTDSTGVAIRIGDNVAAERLATPIDVSSGSVPLEVGLSLILTPLDLALDIRHGLLTIVAGGSRGAWSDPTGVARLAPPVGSAWHDALQRPASLRFDDAPLTEVLDHLATRHGLALRFSDAISDELKSVRVTMTVVNVPLRTGLGVLFDKTDLGVRLDGDMLVIERRRDTVNAR